MNVLITGGSSGLGEAITRKIAANVNFKVYFTYNQSKDNAQDIERENLNAVAIHCDFRNPESYNTLVQRLSELDIDILINNAYIGEFIKSHFHKTSLSEFGELFTQNILPTVAITQAAIRIFRKKKSGKIITILSAALIGSPPIGSSVYLANKAYLKELTKMWAIENSKFNITSNTISPTLMLTGLTRQMDERLIEQIANDSPLKKLMTTNEVADSVLFLISSTLQINDMNTLINPALNIQ